MKGPYERLKYDLRRVWECPNCHHRVRTSGDVTSMHCSCMAETPLTEQVSMKLVENGPRPTGLVGPPEQES